MKKCKVSFSIQFNFIQQTLTEELLLEVPEWLQENKAEAGLFSRRLHSIWLLTAAGGVPREAESDTEICAQEAY